MVGRASWLILLIGCQPLERLPLPDWPQAQTVVRLSDDGEGPRLELADAVAGLPPFSSGPGGARVELAGYSQTRVELGWSEGLPALAALGQPRRAFPRPEWSWSFVAGAAPVEQAHESPSTLAELRLADRGCHDFRAEALTLPRAVGHVRYFDLLAPGRLFVITSRYPEHPDFVGSFRYYLIEGERITEVAIPGAPPAPNGYFVAPRGQVWFTYTASAAQAFGPAVGGGPWVPVEVLHFPPPASTTKPIGWIDGIDRDGERDLYFTTEDGVVYRVTDRVEVLEGRDQSSVYPHRTFRLGPDQALALHGPSLVHHVAGREPVQIGPPDNTDVKGLESVSPQSPLGLVVTADSGPRSKLLLLDLERQQMDILRLPYGGEQYINNIYFDQLTPLFDTWVLPGDNGYLLELVPFEHDQDGQVVGWDLCPPAQIGGGDFHRVVQDGEVYWTGGATPDGPDDRPVRIYRGTRPGD